MFPFDSPENIRKPKASRCFQGDQKGTLGRKGLFNLNFTYHTKLVPTLLRSQSSHTVSLITALLRFYFSFKNCRLHNQWLISFG